MQFQQPTVYEISAAFSDSQLLLQNHNTDESYARFLTGNTQCHSGHIKLAN